MLNHSTMVLKGQLIHQGIRFLWWVVDGTPAVVTVSHPARGTRSGETHHDPVRTARGLAEQILASD